MILWSDRKKTAEFHHLMEKGHVCIKRPIDSTKSGQTDGKTTIAGDKAENTRGQTNGQTSNTTGQKNEQMSTTIGRTDGQTSTVSGQTSFRTDLLRVLSNNHDGTFCQNSLRLKTINYFCEKKKFFQFFFTFRDNFQTFINFL